MMFKWEMLKGLMLIGLALGVAGCGGSSDSDDDNFADAYLQFYNGSANSPSTDIIADSNRLGSSSYGDVTSLFSLTSGDLDIQLSWEDGDGQELTASEFTTNLQDGYKTLLVMSGDFDAPEVSEFQFERSDLDDEFYLYSVSVIPEGQAFDLYISESGVPFSAANFISRLDYLAFNQGAFWDPSENDNAWPEGEYVIYLTEPGSGEVAFESQEINFEFSSDYVLIVRNTSGANDDNIVVDIVLNSTSIEANQNITASSQFRVYSALSAEVELALTLTAHAEEEYSQTVTGGLLSDFTNVTFGDYQISAINTSDSNASFDNRLMTLNQGASKTLLVFEDAEGDLTSIEVSDSTLPQSFEHEVNVANLLPEFNEVDVYFVRQDETIETADYKMTSLGYADDRSITLPNDFYSITVVYEDSLGVDTLLYRSELLDFTVEDVLLVTVEAEPEDEFLSGYRARLLY